MSSYCSFSPCKTTYFLPFIVILPANKLPHSWLTDVNPCPSLSGHYQKGFPKPPQGLLTQPAATTPRPRRSSVLAAVPPTTTASCTENSKRSWLLPELHVEIHPCPISPLPGPLWETTKTFRRKAGLYDLFTYAVDSASSRGTVYWHNCFAVMGETYDTDTQSWY